MGNYYRNYRRFGKKRSKGPMIFFVGGILVLLLVLAQFSPFGDSMKNTALAGADRIAGVFREVADWGKSQFNAVTSLAVPVSSGVVVEEFGVVTDADGKESYHKGIDIQVPAGSEVLAAADGKVADVSQHDDGTYWITVAHEQNWSTVYGRLGEACVAVGDEVKKGDAIGIPANEILHFEVLEGETEKDPVGFFETGTDG